MIIIICGYRGSGKSLFGALAKKEGFPVFEMGEPILELMRELGLETSNEGVRNFATEFREKGGPDAVAKLLLPKIRESLRQNRTIVVVGARSLEEVGIFEGAEPVVRVALLSSEANRFERIKRRRKPSDPLKIGDFRWADGVEVKWGLPRLVDSCEVKIRNDSGEKIFREKILEFLEKHREAPANPQRK